MSTENDVISGMDAQQIDQAITSTREQIEAAIKEEHALIGEKLPLASTLKHDFKDDQLFLGKVDQLAELYSDLVKVRPDGNCFYTAFAFSLFEQLIQDTDQLSKVKQLMKGTRDFLIEKLNYPDITVDDFYDTGLFFKVEK